jgi:hypothetical protein
MKAEHFEILVEEPSMEGFLSELLPRLVGGSASFQIHVHQGKNDLLRKLGSRLRGYAHWLPQTSRIVVVVDRDNEDCVVLKQRIEQEALDAGLRTRTTCGAEAWQVVNRVAIEELEAWFFGQWGAVRGAFPRVPATIPNRAAYRNPDAILGGTWEALERILKRAGYFAGGLRKVETARAIGRHFDPAVSTSASFTAFRHALLEAIEPT